MTYGYARVSTLDQNLDRPVIMLKQGGINELFTEKMSGTKKNRPELDRLLAQLKAGDTVIVESLSGWAEAPKT